MKTNGDIWRDRAEQAGIPLVSIWSAQDIIARAKKNKADATFARLMLSQGRLTDEARAWLAKEYPQ